MASREEIKEELCIADHELRHRNSFRFFGVAKNIDGNYTNVIGACFAHLEWIPEERFAVNKSDIVSSFDRCPFHYLAAARFVEQKHYWDPTSIVAMILALETRFPHNRVRGAFMDVIGKIE